jgi:tetratricopeptide (TPR) repeat protein
VTEYLYSVLAAYAAPKDPYPAFAAGRAARRHGRIDDARTWFKRTIALARRADDEAASASAYLGWGILEERQGNRERAATKFLKAWRAAKRGGLPELAGASRHNMIAVALSERDFAAGNAHIVAAYKLYGRGNPQLYRLANDAAGFWSTFGYFSISLPLFEAALPHVLRADEKMAILANISRAAAALGMRDRYLEAWDTALELERAAGEALPEIYMELARGAWALGYYGRAKELATKALQVSTPETTARRAESLLDNIVARRPPDPAREADLQLQRFAARFSQRLRGLEQGL